MPLFCFPLAAFTRSSRLRNDLSNRQNQSRVSQTLSSSWTTVTGRNPRIEGKQTQARVHFSKRWKFWVIFCNWEKNSPQWELDFSMFEESKQKTGRSFRNTLYTHEGNGTYPSSSSNFNNSSLQSPSKARKVSNNSPLTVHTQNSCDWIHYLLSCTQSVLESLVLKFTQNIQHTPNTFSDHTVLCKSLANLPRNIHWSGHSFNPIFDRVVGEGHDNRFYKQTKQWVLCKENITGKMTRPILEEEGRW